MRPRFFPLFSLLATLLPLAPASLSAADLFPFVLPWDDSAASITDLSGWHEKPAGGQGFITVADGHLAESGKRFRIFGVNCAFGANFPDNAAAPKVAARMAKYGINCVRFHHMDMQTAPDGIWSAGMRTLDPAQLEKLDWFIAKLKENGIYADLNLHVSRTYSDRPAAEKQGNASFDKGVDNFAHAMIDEQKEYARALLTHVNPHTGHAYFEEPAVALIEINNENALLFEWWTGGLDTIAAPYRTELSALWTDWLKAKYPADRALEQAWGAGAKEGGAGILRNGNFEKGLEGWALEQHEGAEATAEVTPIAGAAAAGARLLRVRVTKPGHLDWHVQIARASLALKAGESYEATFRARADGARTAAISASMAHEPWGVFASKEIKLRTEWQNYSFSFTAAQDEANARLSLTGMGTQVGAFEFADLHLAPRAVKGTVSRDAAGQIAAFTRDEYAGRTLAAQEDWYHFLWSLEQKYWPGMRGFLRDELHAKPLIVGTQLFWSPFPIQSKMDVIDSHAYWQHPQFAKGQWDTENWTVKNVPMAGAEDGGTLRGLGLQRVWGKPYICTEYNHSSPNTYSAETFPLLCAYAAWQDWDGIFAFAYSHRTDDWDARHFPNFFDIDQHPVKMAALPGALATWLRGDLAPAEGEKIVALTEQAAFERARRSGPRISADAFGATLQDALTRRVGVQLDNRLGETGSSITEKPAGPHPAFVWDTANRCVTLDTARSKAVIGRMAGRQFTVGGITIQPGRTRQDWACLQLTVMEGATFEDARRILITATADVENTGMKWHNPEKTTVGHEWGAAPSLVEGVPATITLPRRPGMKAWALDERGVRRGAVPIENGTISIGSEYKTLWYEVAAE